MNQHDNISIYMDQHDIYKIIKFKKSVFQSLFSYCDSLLFFSPAMSFMQLAMHWVFTLNHGVTIEVSIWRSIPDNIRTGFEFIMLMESSDAVTHLNVSLWLW